MTAIKQKAICSKAHWKSVSRYLSDNRTLTRESQHIVNEDRWYEEMHATREAYGHNEPGKRGATCTYAFHQVIAFLPGEASCNGGIVTPEFAMAYVREYVQTRYPNQEAVWALHCERSGDGTSRFAVHVVVNRTDLETGKRLNEGRSRNAKIARANAIRDMDAKYGLAQLREGERNSLIHARQPSLEEQKMAARGVRSDKQYIRDAIRASIREARTMECNNKMRALAKQLDGKGIDMKINRSRKSLEFERRSSNFKVRGYKLGRGFSIAGICHGLGLQALELSMREEELERE